MLYLLLITPLINLLELFSLQGSEKILLWKPYANENKGCKNKRAIDVRSSYTPVNHESRKTDDKSKPLALPVDAFKHVDERQISLQNVKLTSYKLAKSGSELCKSLAESKQYQCNQCKRTYSTNAALVKHQRYYCNFYQTKSFTCKYCDKVYLSLGALKMHIRTHTLPCTCAICGKAFSRPWLLQGHVRTHTGEKPYHCSHCNRAFADRSNLRAHLQTHSQVKKYKCEKCLKTFSRMSLLIKHQTSRVCDV